MHVSKAHVSMMFYPYHGIHNMYPMAGQPVFPRGGAGWGGASIPDTHSIFNTYAEKLWFVKHNVSCIQNSFGVQSVLGREVTLTLKNNFYSIFSSLSHPKAPLSGLFVSQDKNSFVILHVCISPHPPSSSSFSILHMSLNTAPSLSVGGPRSRTIVRPWCFFVSHRNHGNRNFNLLSFNHFHQMIQATPGGRTNLICDMFKLDWDALTEEFQKKQLWIRSTQGYSFCGYRS